MIPEESALDCIEPPVTLRTLAMVKGRWGIAIRALIRRCLDLQIIDAHHRVSLEKQIAARGWTREEPVPVPYEEPLLLRRLIESGLGSAGASAAPGPTTASYSRAGGVARAASQRASATFRAISLRFSGVSLSALSLKLWRNHFGVYESTSCVL